MAKDIYVKAGGSNGSSGLVMANPVQTPSYALGIAAPGDRILVYGGDNFFGNLHQNKSGINWDVYGPSQQPVFSGLVTLTGWVNQGNGIWIKSEPSLGTTLRKVTIDGVEKPKGRYPKFNPTTHGFINIQSGTSTSLTAPEVGTMPNFVGGELVFKSIEYAADIVRITGRSGNTFTYTGTVQYGGAKSGYGFFVQNHVNCLTEFGEWAYDPSTKTISMYFGSENPNDYTIKASSTPNLVTVGGNPSDVQYNNIILEGSNLEAMLLTSASAFSILDCEIRQTGLDGIFANNHQHMNVQRTHFHHINNNAFFLGQNTDYGHISGSLVEEVGMHYGHLKGGLGCGIGIHIPWFHSLAERNHVRNCGQTGIRYEKAYTQCNYNHVHHASLRFSDAGLIYNWNGSTNNDKQPGMRCIGNIVYGAPRVNQGTNKGNQHLNHGIYQDDHTAGAPNDLHEIRGNVVYDIEGVGIFLHNSESFDIVGNTVFNCNHGLQISSDTPTGGERMEDLHFRNNIMVAKTAYQTSFFIFSNQPDIANMVGSPADWNNNVLARPIADTDHIRIQQVTTTTFYGLPSWPSVMGWDADSTGSPVAITDVNQFRMETNPSDSSITVTLSDGTYIDMHGEVQQSIIELSPHSGILLIRTSETPPPPVNPTVQFTNLVEGSRIIYPNALTVTATVTASNPVTKVEFFQGATLVGTAIASPWEATLNLEPGEHYIQAKVTDSEDLVGYSDALFVEVLDFIEDEQVHVRINVGTNLDVIYEGETFKGDRNFLDLYTPGALEDNVSPDTTEVLFLTGRAAPVLTYNIPLPNGSYTVRTMHNEPWFGVHDGQPAGPGKRVFDINLQGQLVKEAFDIYLENNNENTTLTFENIEVTNGELVILLNNSNNKANLSGLEIFPYEEVVVDKFALAVRENPLGWGTAVDVTNEGPYPAGTVVELQATANANTEFYRWSLDGQTLSTNPNDTYTTRAQEDLVLGEFLPKKYALTLDGQMKGSGTGGGNFPEGTVVQLEATAFSGLQFDGWYRDNELLSKANPYNYTTRAQADVLVMKFVSVPVSVPEADKTSGPAPLTVKFSCDWFVEGTTYFWDFKDGNTSVLKSPEHTFAAGTYDVTLTVTVGELSATETIQITAIQPANHPPTVAIISPTNLSANFVAPASILITTAASDPEGNITKVEFYANNEKIGEKLEAPYSFTWEGVPVGVYSLQVKVYDEVQHSDSVPVSVSVYDPTAGYILNGKHLSEYGIIPAQAPDSNIALTGAWDMPSRTGKIYHEWPDENNVEPYLLASELFYAGRDMKFYGLLQAESDQEARDKLYELYADVDKSTSVFPFSSEWGSWEVHVLDGIKAESLGNGWYSIILPLRQPVVEMQAVLPEPSGEGFGIDGYTWGELGLILLETTDATHRAEVRQAETTIYGREPVGVKKRGLKEFKLRFVLREDTYEVFNNRINVLLAIFSSPGARTFRLEDGTYREGFIKDGFSVSQFMYREGEVSAVLELTVAQIRQLNTWNLFTDGLGRVLTDGRGRPLTDLLKWI